MGGRLIDINEIFDGIALSEDNLVKEGYSKGYGAGEREGIEEGENLGREKGWEIGAEIGFYLGFVRELKLKNTENTGDSKRSQRISEAARKLEEAAKSFPLVNCKEDLTAHLDSVRSRFKLLCSLLKISSDFESSSKKNW